MDHLHRARGMKSARMRARCLRHVENMIAGSMVCNMGGCYYISWGFYSVDVPEGHTYYSADWGKKAVNLCNSTPGH